jgi:TatD DNase family protein
MAKKKSIPIPEAAMLLQYTAATTTGQQDDIMAVVDTHMHLISTFSAYRSKYPEGNYQTVHEFVRGFYSPRPSGEVSEQRALVTKLVDVYCDAPIVKAWKEIADSALIAEQRQSDWGGIEYYFVIGVHPHNASQYSDGVENDLYVPLSQMLPSHDCDADLKPCPILVASEWAKWVSITTTIILLEPSSGTFWSGN